jgi:hypothetical protein
MARAASDTQSDGGLTLHLADLLPDAEGELVLFADPAQQVTLFAEAPLTAQGVADPHVTASGYDVTGLTFLSFANGVTLYYSGALSLFPDPAA